MEIKEEKMQKVRMEYHSASGLVWIWAWLFTVGFLHLGFWKAALGILLWPYYLGVHFSTLAH